MKRIDESGNGGALEQAARAYLAGRQPAALTGAGISVECGIPDFRSADGLWRVFDPAEYGTLEAFAANPDKAWKLYRALADTIVGRRPGPAHSALARLEAAGLLTGVITQNIDGLHSAAGSRNVAEVHGEHRRLHCLQCGEFKPLEPRFLNPGPAPRCGVCDFPLKPNVVLFGELIRETDLVKEMIQGCDLLLVVGTSAEVYPVADYPLRVLNQGGKVFEFNIERTPLTPHADFFFEGRASVLVARFADAVLAARPS